MNAPKVPQVDRTFRGYWHVKDPETLIPGTATYSRDAGPALDINGTFLGKEGASEFGRKQLFGRDLDGTRLTLQDAHNRSQRSTSFNDEKGSPRVQAEVWSGGALVVGAWLPKGSRTKIRQLKFRSPLLREWTQRLRPNVEETWDEGRMGGYIETPENISVKIPDGRIEFSWHVLHKATYPGGSLTIQLVPELHFHFEAALEIDDAWHRAIVPTLQFLSFCIGAGDSIEGLLMNESPGDLEDFEDSGGKDSYGSSLYGGWFEWCPTSWMTKPYARELPNPYHFTCAPPRDAGHFSTLLEGWFSEYDRLKPAIFDFTSIQMWSSMTIEESFYRVARSLEVLNGILDPAPHIPRATFKALKKKIKTAIFEEDYGAWLYSRLAHADSPTLRERLWSLCKQSPSLLENRFSEDLIRKIVKTRNEIAHTGEAKSLNGNDLYDAFHLLSLLMNSALLRVLDSGSDESQEQLWNTADARAINHSLRIPMEIED